MIVTDQFDGGGGGRLSTGRSVLAAKTLSTTLGIDNVISLMSEGILLWRLLIEMCSGSEEQARRVDWDVAISHSFQCLNVPVTAVYGLLMHTWLESSASVMTIAETATLAIPAVAAVIKR